jgi:hypothetical protein
MLLAVERRIPAPALYDLVCVVGDYGEQRGKEIIKHSESGERKETYKYNECNTNQQ